MKKIFKVLAIIALVAVIGFSMACGGGGDNTHEHKWGNWNVTTAATCSATGTGSRVCTVCGETDPNTTIPIDPTAHNYQFVEGSGTAPTCTEDGKGNEICSYNASHTKSNVVIPKLGHDYEWVVTTPVTDTTDGKETKTCKRNPTHTDGTRTIPKPFTDISAFATWLSAQLANTPENAYSVKLNMSSFGEDNNWNFGEFLNHNSTKYVSIDLSGSTFTSIGNSAFRNCSNLTSITIPDCITSIGLGAFLNCNLTSITIPFVGATKNGTTNTHFGYIFGASSYSGQNSSIPASLKTVIITGSNSIPDNAFYRCTSLTSVTIGNSVTIIGNYSFQDCTSLTSVTIGNSVTSIWGQAFSNCTSLRSVRFEGAGSSFNSDYFPSFPNASSLQTAYSAGGIGTYTLSGSTWTKTSN